MKKQTEIIEIELTKTQREKLHRFMRREGLETEGEALRQLVRRVIANEGEAIRQLARR